MALMPRLLALAAIAIAVAVVLPCAAQTINIYMLKGRNFLQYSPSDITPDPNGSPFGFSADVSDFAGNNISGISPPMLAGPVNVGSLGCFWNGGQLVYSTLPGGSGWRIGTPNSNRGSPLPINFDWVSPTQADLDSNFSNGVYIFNVNGTNVALNMAGDQYPAPPTLSLSGGTWSNGIYVIDTTKPFTVTATYAGYGGHVGDTIELAALNQHAGTTPTQSTNNTLTVTVPANSLPNNGTPALVQATFSVNVDTNNAVGFGVAVYSTSTYVIVNNSPNSSSSLNGALFPMVVNENIGSITSCVNAKIQPRPQDVGTTQSVFVFAQAPSSIVRGVIPKRVDAAAIPAATDDTIYCVLAQLGSDGQLHAVSASSMQALVTEVLAQQAQLGDILKAFTTNVAGSTVFVGYGTSAASMLASGLFQDAAVIQGTVQCTASLTSAAAAKLPGSVSGLWWNAAESGWGIHTTQRGSNTFAAWYTYDASGNPKWYVSTCAGLADTSGTCNGTLYEVTGPNFFGGAFNPSLVNATNAGTLRITFTNANAASMNYTVAGQTRTVALTRQPLATGTISPAIDYTDLWWNPSESGWGMAMAQQYGITFLAWYVYDTNGKPTWEVATCTMSGSSCSGTLYRTTGPPFGPTFDSTKVHATAVGSVIVSFIGANDAVLSYTVNGSSATKVITRQLF